MASVKFIFGTIYQVERRKELDVDKLYAKVLLEPDDVNSSEQHGVRGQGDLYGGISLVADPNNPQKKITQYGLWVPLVAPSKETFRTTGFPKPGYKVRITEIGRGKRKTYFAEVLAESFPKDEQIPIITFKGVARFLV